VIISDKVIISFGIYDPLSWRSSSCEVVAAMWDEQADSRLSSTLIVAISFIKALAGAV
jgi:hypothetical protein